MWHPLVIGLGGFTMLVGGWRALRQTDLKLLLAYGTVSQLGFLVMVVGQGTRDAALAGTALLLAHALFKAALFLTVGIVDHAAGHAGLAQAHGPRPADAVARRLRDRRRGVDGRPAAAARLRREGGGVHGAARGRRRGRPVGVGALAAAVVGSMLTVAYSVRFVWGAFGTRPMPRRSSCTASPALMSLAPGLLAAASLATALAPPAVEPLLAPTPLSCPGPTGHHLALWHGLEPALAISALVFAVGAGLVWGRATVARLQAAVPDSIEAARGYVRIVGAVDRGAARLTTLIQSGGLPGTFAVIVGVFILGLGGAAILNDSRPGDIRFADSPAQPLVGLAMVVAAIAAVVMRQRIAAVLLVGATGYGMVLIFGMAGAPDLALTQALVETITIVVVVLVLRRLPRRVSTRRPIVRAPARIALGVLAGAVMAVVGVVALGARTAPSIAEGLPALAAEAHAKNIVNALLVDLRAWDTLGEISVLVAVATGVASLIFVSGRMGGAGSRPRSARAPRPLPEQADSMRSARRRLADVDDETDAAAEAASTRQTWLVAGRTISPRNRSILVEVLVRLLFHPVIVVSVFLLFVGHNAPGGGFAGGLVAGLALVARYLAGGRYELGEAAPVDAGALLGTGLLLAAGTAASSLVFGLTVFESSWFEADVPLLGTISIGTSTLFDIGVYLVVVGLVLDILRTLGAEIDRQIDEAGPDAVAEDPAEVRA